LPVQESLLDFRKPNSTRFLFDHFILSVIGKTVLSLSELAANTTKNLLWVIGGGAVFRHVMC